MINEFSRTQMLIGNECMDKIANSKVLIFGVGGVGSHCIEALARSGIGEFILVDNDVVSLTNINRQAVAFHSTIGQYKTHVMKRIIKDINPKAIVNTLETFVLKDNLEDVILSDIDYIVDAIDTVTAKLSIVEKAKELNIPIISCMGTGNKLHADMFEITDIYKTSVCPLCKVMRKELKVRGIKKLKVLYSKEQPIDTSKNNTDEVVENKRQIPGSISFVPPVAGLLIAGEVIRDIIA